MMAVSIPRLGRPRSEGEVSAEHAEASKPRFHKPKPPSTAKSPSGLSSRPRTGLRAAKSRLFLRGLAAVDKRTAAARSYVTTRQALLDHLGGPESVSETQAQLVELVSRGLLYIGHLDAAGGPFRLAAETRPAQRRRRCWPNKAKSQRTSCTSCTSHV